MTGHIAYLQRSEQFCAGHRMHNPKFDVSTNKKIFGKCNNDNGHGHNYTLVVTVKGMVDKDTGMVINLFDLKRYIHQIVEPLDHKMLNKDIEYFLAPDTTNDTSIDTSTINIPSAENIALYVWNEMEKVLPENVKMHRVKLYETDKNCVEYRGE
ncbi:6-pyruvoyl tetrahydrobiopterin synthase, partial [Fragariocoptes setiger]